MLTEWAEDVLAFVLIVGLFWLAWVVTPGDAECAYCPSYTCFSRCTNDCACVRVGGEVGGQCMSWEAIPSGAEVLP